MKRTSFTRVPFFANVTESIKRRMMKIPKPRLRSSGPISLASAGASKPSPLSWISMRISSSWNEHETEKPPLRRPRPYSEALLSASPAANRMSAAASSSNPQSRAKDAIEFRASATLRGSLVKVAR